MKSENIYACITLLMCFLSATVVCATDIPAQEIKTHGGANWSIYQNNEGYNIKYINKKNEIFENRKIITQDLSEGDFELESKGSDKVSLVLNYPRDVYIFDFLSEDIPYLKKACKEISLQPASENQVVTALTLCVKDKYVYKMSLPDVDADNLLSPEKLHLDHALAAVISSNKAFLYDENKKQYIKKPYLIKGDIIEVLDYDNSWIKIKHSTQKKNIITWIKLTDIL
ncbi:hypothetical protein AB6866_23030 [Rahnella inusitata]|uniref:hypothetical protein n=1 Tax=Rahnella inusitata TaxID=58169 RepID=UPI0039BE8D21